jgi:uncharacterized protein YqfB (UPF0267 family)
MDTPEMTKEAPSSPPPIALTFFGWLLPLVTSGLKTITIRDAAEADLFTPHVTTSTTLPVYALEDSTRHHPVCYVVLRSVKPLAWDDINESHARQECMSLSRLQGLLREIYPNEESLYLINYEVVAMGPLASWTQAGHSLLYYIVGPVLGGLLWLCGLR